MTKTFTFSHDGTTWELERPTLSVERAFCTYLEGRELAIIQRHAQREISQVAFDSAIARWVQECGACNKFGWNRPAFRQALDDKGNVIHLLSLWFQENHVRIKKAGGDPGELLTEAKLHAIWDELTEATVKLVEETGTEQTHPLVILVRDVVSGGVSTK